MSNAKLSATRSRNVTPIPTLEVNSAATGAESPGDVCLLDGSVYFREKAAA